MNGGFMKEFYYEKQILDNTISIVKNVLTAEEKDLDNLYNNYKENQEELWEYANQKEIHVHNLKFSLEKPYFARIDFILNNENQKKSYYIGKNGVYSDNELIVTDWRAPISSLYYDSEIGKSAFENNIINSLNIPSSVETIEKYAFRNNNINSFPNPIDITDNVKSNGTSKFVHIVSTNG
jgi:DNA helicase IV